MRSAPHRTGCRQPQTVAFLVAAAVVGRCRAVWLLLVGRVVCALGGVSRAVDGTRFLHQSSRIALGAGRCWVRVWREPGLFVADGPGVSCRHRASGLLLWSVLVRPSGLPTVRT
jgi:hypothetical protein